MKHAALAVAVLFGVGFALQSRADEGHEHAMKPGSKEFERMKQLVGTWKGPADMDGKKGETTIVYKLTGAGSALVETIDPGTPHEMVTVYHDEAGKLAMTHYCAAGNQPHMVLTRADDKMLSLEFDKATGIDPKKDMHMHALTLQFDDKDHVTARWTSMAGGKDASHAVFTLARADVKPAK